MNLVGAITKMYGVSEKTCYICNEAVVYPDGVYAKGGKRLYHKECIRQRRAQLRERNSISV